MIDIKRYLDLKEKGMVTLAKVGKAYVTSSKTFDPQTGEELDPLTEAFSMEDVQKLKTDADKLSASVATFLEDLTALEA